MSAASPGFLLYTFLVLFNEFTLKALFEAWARDRDPTRHALIYVTYRGLAFSAHTISLWMAFDVTILQAMGAGAVLTGVGSVELVAALLGAWSYMRTRRSARPLLLISTIALAIGLVLTWRIATWPSGWGSHVTTDIVQGWMPGGNDPYLWLRWALIYFAASIPANYLIRWLMNKPEDPTLPEMAASSLIAAFYRTPGQSEALGYAAASDSTSQTTLRAGRVIGILERWILLALVARGEMAAIGFIFTAKSIVRYREFDRHEFAEYYLIGTLYSIVTALILGALM